MTVSINWNLLQPVDIGGSFLQGLERGKAMAREAAVEGALRDYSLDPSKPMDDKAVGVLAAYAPDRLAGLERIRQSRTEELINQRRRAVVEQYRTDPSGARQAAAVDPEVSKIIDQMDERQRGQVAMGARLVQEFNPTDEASWQRTRQAASQAGIDLSNVPENFDPQYVESLKHLGGVLNTTKAPEQPASVREYQFAQGQGYGGTFMDWQAENGSPVVVDNGDGTKTIYPRSALRGQGSAQPAAENVGQVLSSALPAPVVSGFLGNFHAEGGYGGAKGDGGSAAGIAQWRGERQVNFQKFIGKPVDQATPEEQAKFVLWEMQNPEQAGMTVAQRDAILAAKTPAEAASLIDQYYERSSGEHRQKRIAAAEEHGGTIRVASKGDFDKLASGTRFIAPDGTVRIKP